ncbi:response regulator [uncultured Polaribacter sp.]|uniref:response regulator transcription factor n=1 Tax=uncultured Polaribacter sp. TaxID=174711 RepID=UPI0026112354|nr:response regulator [uncultured Polaribacter sp.]
MKAHILIVEDEPTLYEGLRRALVKQRFTVDDYTKSYDEAIERIHKNLPDVVLLDINLQGKKDGLDLGKILQKKYKIRFIYVTDFDDDMTFQKGLHTNHQHFIVKTKPTLNITEITRAIHTVLHKKETLQDLNTKNGVLGLVGYLDNIKEYGIGNITRVPVAYTDIAFFTIKPFVNENEKKEKLRDNYLWFLTKKKHCYFLKTSLKKLAKTLPNNFIRINESYIVNINPAFFNGSVNGSKIVIKGEELVINSTYKKAFEKRMEQLYHS